MLINELSRLTGVNGETIRDYRKAGLLNPVQNPYNKYYYYTERDIYYLFSIKRLRQINTPLADIRSFLIGTSDPVTLYQEQLEARKKEARRLAREIEIAENRLKNAIECKENAGKVILKYHDRRKYDLPVNETFRDHPDVYDQWLSNLDILPLSFHVKQEHLILQEDGTHDVEASLCFGCHEHKLKERGLSLTGQEYICPPGMYLSMIIKVPVTRNLIYSDIEPLLKYAEEHRMHFVSDMTGYLLQTTEDNGTYCNHVRIRARVEGNNDLIEEMK